jgi:hypothetical protein
MAQEPTSLGSNFYLNPLDEKINLLAYRYNFLNIKSAEPSLGIPVSSRYALQNQVYYFPIITNASTYIDSRRFSNSNNTLVYFNDNIGIGSQFPEEKLTVVGNISGTQNIVIGENNFSNSSSSSILAGAGNCVLSEYSTIGGGQSNSICADSSYSYIGAGFLNQINAPSGLISGGTQNIICGNSSSIGGGGHNTICAAGSNINGGNYNLIESSADNSSITGGSNNTVSGYASIINGGFNSCNTGDFSTVSGGYKNLTESGFGSVVGGYCNTASGYYGSFVSGGGCNKTQSNSNSILGGYCNTASGDYSVILGGCQNNTMYSYANILGGLNNKNFGYTSSILGGQNNQLSANNSFILGSNIVVPAGFVDTTFVENLSVLRDITSDINITGNVKIQKNLLVYGSISALSGLTNIASQTVTTSSLRIENYGVGPALYVFQDLDYPISEFVSNQLSTVFYIGNTPANPLDGTTGFIGINTNTPNVELTVNGSISSTGIIYASGGNSEEWNRSSAKAITSIGNNVNTSFVYFHNLNTRDIITQVYDNSSYEVVYPSIANTSTNSITILFATAPTSNQYRIVVRG